MAIPDGINARLATLVVVLAGLAGCSGDGKPDGTTIELGDGTEVELGDAGAITGVVIDEAIRPIAGANVTVLGQGVTVGTDATGVFVVPDLEPGFYVLAVSAAGFLPTQTQAEVTTGEPAKVRAMLMRDTSPQPYHTTMSFDWYDQAGVTLVDFAIDLSSRSFLNGSLPPACDRCYFFFAADEPPAQILLEATWDDTVAKPTGTTSFYWVMDGLDSGEYEDDYCEDPCYVLVPMGKFGNDTNYGFGISADETWVTYQQKMQVFVTLWYRAGPPEGWSIVAGTGEP